jgi:hypothetical protein
MVSTEFATINALGAALLLAGCSMFTPPKAKPVIEDRVSDWGVAKVSVLATTAERRVVLVVMPERKFCAEAPPDVGEAVSSSLGASLDAEGAGKVTALEAQLNQQLATSLLQLSHRSQGLELYRASTFVLCTLYLNGVISAGELAARHDTLLGHAVDLIKQEIPEIAEIKGRIQVTTPAPVLNNGDKKPLPPLGPALKEADK